MDYTKERNNLIDVHEICKTSVSKALELPEEVFFRLGAEIEFYLVPIGHLDINNIVHPLDITRQNYPKYKYNDDVILCISKEIRAKMLEFAVEVSEIEREDGKNQFEIQIPPMWHPVKLGDAISRLKAYLPVISRKYGLETVFSAKPFLRDAGSSMHIHVSLYNKKGFNIFQHYGEFSSLLSFAIGGIMRHAKALVYPACGDGENAYYRFVRPAFGQVHINYPTNFSWGINNRTCMIRIPSSANMDMRQARFEFRLPCPMANPYILLSGLLYALSFGIVEQVIPPQEVYGNAFDRQYDDLLEIIPKNLQDAKNHYFGSHIEMVIEGHILQIGKILSLGVG